MQPFDVLTIKAVLQEAIPFLINKKVDKIQQIGRDEIVITFRCRAGFSYLLLSAHASFGHICLTKMARETKRSNPPGFCMLLRKHLAGATLVKLEQIAGERIVDLIFSCPDDFAQYKHKVLTAEIMGRYSNLIFWEKADDKILGSSHVVTSEMSRQREILPGLKYVRPPGQGKPNIYRLSKQEFVTLLTQQLTNKQMNEMTLETELLNIFSGLGRNLAGQIVDSLPHEILIGSGGDLFNFLWSRVEEIQDTVVIKPAMRDDLTSYTVVSWRCVDQAWKQFPSANDMVEEYYRELEKKEQFQQLKDRLLNRLRPELNRLLARQVAAQQYLKDSDKLSDYKKFGDLILANVSQITLGQPTFTCTDLYSHDESEITIELNANLSAAQNAQQYYRSYAKMRSRQALAQASLNEVASRLETISMQMKQVENAQRKEDLEELKEHLLPKSLLPQSAQAGGKAGKKGKPRLLKVVSADGWTIYMGRNRRENDVLLSQIAQPGDIWMHNIGQGGAHVLIKVPSSKLEPPLSTLKEAGQIAARLSRHATGFVNVAYTQCRYLRKTGKAGLVRYENEKTLSVDISQPMPNLVKRLFACGNDRQN